MFSKLYFILESHLPKWEHNIGANCNCFFFPFCYASPFNTQLRLYSRWRQLSLSHQLPVPLVSPRPFLSSLRLPAVELFFLLCHFWSDTKMDLFPHLLKYSTLQWGFFFSLFSNLFLTSCSLNNFPHVAVLPNLTSVFISPSSAGI